MYDPVCGHQSAHQCCYSCIDTDKSDFNFQNSGSQRYFTCRLQQLPVNGHPLCSRCYSAVSVSVLFCNGRPTKPWPCSDNDRGYPECRFGLCFYRYLSNGHQRCCPCHRYRSIDSGYRRPAVFYIFERFTAFHPFQTPSQRAWTGLL